MWCLLVLYYFICHIPLHWCLLSFKVLSMCHFSSVINSHTQCKQESWLQDEVQGISLLDTRGQNASKKLLQRLSETVCFKGSFWTETFPFFALDTLAWSLAACWRAKCHTEQGVISHCAVRVESGTKESLKRGEWREKGMHVIYNVERVLPLTFCLTKACWKLPFKPRVWSLVLNPLSCLLSHDQITFYMLYSVDLGDGYAGVI